MSTIEINGKQFTFEGKKMILQVANDNGLEIPQYCYHPGLSIVASCRICLAEVESRDPKDPTKMVKLPKLTPTCQTPASDGMKVTTLSPKARANQQAVMEFLLLNHPLDCPVCDQAGECFLQDYSYKFGRAQSRLEEDKVKNPKKDVGEHILLYSDRCIFCSRCVRFTREVSGTGELAFFGRGDRQEIDIVPGEPVNNPLAGNVVDICPVGALLDKDFLFNQRVWFLRSTPSVSPTSSGGEAIFIHHNEGRIYRIKPRFSADNNKWWISDETRYGFKFVHEDRLTVPERLENGSRVEATWEEASAELTAAFKAIVAEKGQGSLAAILSPCDATEDQFMMARWIRSIDPQALLILNAPRIDGQDQIFKNPQTGAVTFTIKAEKAPNRVGGEKILKHFGGRIGDLAALASAAGKIAGLLISVDPVEHNDVEIKQAAAGISTIVALATREHSLSAAAVLSLPACAWAEKEGVFENFAGKIQPFLKAIPAVGEARAVGEVFWQLSGQTGLYAAAAVREQMSAAGLSEYAHVEVPQATVVRVDDMQFAEL